jgi:hypothetical protein
VRLFSEMIIFIGISLVIIALIYAAQDAFFADRASARIPGQSRAPVFVHVDSWGFTEDMELPPAPTKPSEPILVRVPIPPPGGPRTEDLLEDGDAFFCAKFRDHVQLFANRGPARSFGFDSCSARPPKR